MEKWAQKNVFTQNAVDRIFDNKVKNYRDKFNVYILKERKSFQSCCWRWQ